MDKLCKNELIDRVLPQKQKTFTSLNKRGLVVNSLDKSDKNK